MTPASPNSYMRARALIGLVRENLPQDAPDDGRTATWPLVGFALIARAAGTFEALIELDPTEHLADCATLARSLYEYIVHLAWLAADPSPARLEEWQKDDLRQVLTADRETLARGFPILESSERTDLHARYEQMKGNRLNLADLATAADKHWTGKVPELIANSGEGPDDDSEGGVFRGMYTVIYRFTSSRAHATYRGTTPVTTRISDKHSRVHMEVDSLKPAWPSAPARCSSGLASSSARRRSSAGAFAIELLQPSGSSQASQAGAPRRPSRARRRGWGKCRAPRVDVPRRSIAGSSRAWMIPKSLARQALVAMMDAIVRTDNRGARRGMASRTADWWMRLKRQRGPSLWSSA